MGTLLIILIGIIALALMVVVLVQNPKGGGFDSTFGNANQFFGASRSADLLEKVTWGLFAALVILSIVSTIFFGGEDIATRTGLID